MNETTERNQLLTAKDVAKMLSTSIRSTWRYRASGLLPKPVKIAGSIRWKLSDIKLFLNCDCDINMYQSRKAVEQ